MEELEIVSFDWKSFFIDVDKEIDMWNVDQNPDIVADPEAYFSSLNWLLTQQKPNLGTRGT